MCAGWCSCSGCGERQNDARERENDGLLHGKLLFDGWALALSSIFEARDTLSSPRMSESARLRSEAREELGHLLFEPCDAFLERRGRRFDRFRSKRVRVALFLLAGAARYAHDELPLDHLAERVL